MTKCLPSAAKATLRRSDFFKFGADLKVQLRSGFFGKRRSTDSAQVRGSAGTPVTAPSELGVRTSLTDKRLIVEHDSAENVLEILHAQGLPLADYIVSGIPLGSFSKDLQTSISRASRDALVGDGRFLVYQFTARVVPVLRETFPAVNCSRELRNIPPAQLFVCSR